MLSSSYMGEIAGDDEKHGGAHCHALRIDPRKLQQTVDGKREAGVLGLFTAHIGAQGARRTRIVLITSSTENPINLLTISFCGDHIRVRSGPGPSEDQGSLVLGASSDVAVGPDTRVELSAPLESTPVESDSALHPTVSEVSTQPSNSVQETSTTPEASVGSEGMSIAQEPSIQSERSDVGPDAMPSIQSELGEGKITAESQIKSEMPTLGAGLAALPPRKKGEESAAAAAAAAASQSTSEGPALGAGLAALPPRRKGKTRATAEESQSVGKGPTLGVGLGALPPRKMGKGPAKATASRSSDEAPTTSGAGAGPRAKSEAGVPSDEENARMARQVRG
eukprot:477271-Prorocentrum_minimum.AAC.5